MPAAKRSRSRSRSRSTPRTTAQKAPKDRVGHVLGQEELAQANQSKVARFSAKNFPSVVEVGVAAIAAVATLAVIGSMVCFSFANLFVFHITPTVLAYFGIKELYSQVNSPGKEDVVTTAMAFVCILFAHFSYAFGRKRVSHSHQAVHAFIYTAACYKMMMMLGDPLSCLAGMELSMAFFTDNFSLLACTVGALSGLIAFVGHMAAPRIDRVVSNKGSEERPRHVVN